MKNYQILLQFSNNHAENKLIVARAIRPFFEGMLRRRFPGSFEPKEWLGEFIIKIQDADTTSNLSPAKTFIKDIEDINEYSKKFHHDRNPNAGSENVSIGELESYVKQTLELIGK